MISALEARRIASEWHGGQASALYALASSGTVVAGLNMECRHLPGNDPDAAALQAWADARCDALQCEECGEYPQDMGGHGCSCNRCTACSGHGHAADWIHVCLQCDGTGQAQ